MRSKFLDKIDKLSNHYVLMFDDKEMIERIGEKEFLRRMFKSALRKGRELGRQEFNPK